MQKSLENYLEAADGAGKIMAHARLLINLAHIYRKIAPPHLSQTSNLVNYKSGIIVIHAASGAVAAKLRQMTPTLAEGFSKLGVECNGLQIKVQAPENIDQSRASTAKPLSQKTTREIEHLRDSLADSPLRAALNQLLENSLKQ